MDLIIISTALGAFIFFLLFHILVLRRVSETEVMKWLVVVFMVSLVFHLLLYAVLVSGSVYQADVFRTTAYWAVSFLIFGLLSISFVMAVFGTTVTSLRIRMLTDIAASGKGITLNQLKKEYNRGKIVRTRVARLVGSGELVIDHGIYRPAEKFSYFIFHTYLLIILNRLYNTQAYITDNIN